MKGEGLEIALSSVRRRRGGGLAGLRQRFRGSTPTFRLRKARFDRLWAQNLRFSAMFRAESQEKT